MSSRHAYSPTCNPEIEVQTGSMSVRNRSNRRSLEMLPSGSTQTTTDRRSRRKSLSLFSNKQQDVIPPPQAERVLYSLQDLILGEVLTQGRDGVLRKAIPKHLHESNQQIMSTPTQTQPSSSITVLKSTEIENPYDEFREMPIEIGAVPVDIPPSDVVVVKETRITNFSQNEAEILLLLTHPNIIQLKGLSEVSSQQKNFIILEYLQGPDLCDLLQETEKLTEEEAGRLFQQAVNAVAYLHSSGFVHRDIKLENFLIVEPFDPKRPDNIVPLCSCHIKLIDFEFATRYDGQTPFTAALGTLRYSSPEVRRKSYLGPEADVWSLGVVLFLLTTGHFPFSKQDLLRKTEKLHEDQLPSYFSKHLKSLLSSMLSHDLKERPTAQDILRHFWLELVNQTGSQKKQPFYKRLFSRKK